MDVDGVAALLEEGCAEFGVPGAQVGLMRGGERSVVCTGTTAFGRDDPVVTTTAFHAGSIAKSLAALVVMSAARRGELDLDVPCGDQADGLWPETPRQLMAQTTGRPNLLPDDGEPIERFVERAGRLPLVHPPGRFSYCNPGWPVLDLLLRARSGGSFEDLARRELGPGITFREPAGAAQGHAAGPGEPAHLDPSSVPAAAAAAGSTWWATGDQLLDVAALHLRDGDARFHPDDVREQRRPYAPVPGATVSDAWGLGWALWDRGDHRAFGWAGFTPGHRTYLRCFPEQGAALVVLTNCAGPLFGPPGGSALFDALLPALLEVLGVPPLAPPDLRGEPSPVADLAGSYGPVSLEAEGDVLLLRSPALGAPVPVRYRRLGADTFVPEADALGAMLIAVENDLLYLGPFAFARR